MHAKLENGHSGSPHPDGMFTTVARDEMSHRSFRIAFSHACDVLEFTLMFGSLGFAEISVRCECRFCTSGGAGLLALDGEVV